MNDFSSHGLTKSKRVIEFFFCVGLFGALGLRLVLILTHVDIFYARISWYSAMVALIVFYYYRFWIENKRRKLILDNNLIEKFEKDQLSNEDKKKVIMLLNSMIISKLRLNFLILLVMTIIALITEVLIDFVF
jgi:hypothetical protein